MQYLTIIPQYPSQHRTIKRLPWFQNNDSPIKDTLYFVLTSITAPPIMQLLASFWDPVNGFQEGPKTDQMHHNM